MKKKVYLTTSMVEHAKKPACVFSGHDHFYLAQNKLPFVPFVGKVVLHNSYIRIPIVLL